jgi:hypothetical protein
VGHLVPDFREDLKLRRAIVRLVEEIAPETARIYDRAGRT